MSEVFAQVLRMVTEVVGEDFLLDADITPDATFSDDLALESIEFVALSEKLQQQYGERVNLVSFLGEMDIDGIMAVTVGQLVGYIEGQLAASV